MEAEKSNNKRFFKIGGKDILKLEQDESERHNKSDSLDNIRVRIGALLKTENVSFFLGAGASIECGGSSLKSIPLSIEKKLHEQGIKGKRKFQIREWLKVFYLASQVTSNEQDFPVGRDEILARYKNLNDENAENHPLKVNFEEVLAILHRWRSALPKSGGELRIRGHLHFDVKAEGIDSAIKHVSHALACVCNLPPEEKEIDCLETHRVLLRKLLTRPLNLKRANIFTLNYDTLIEQAADAEGIVLVDGFIGNQNRVFRPESYEQDFYFPAETTEGRVHRFDRVLHLYKLHGSITWQRSQPTINNPYGVQADNFLLNNQQPLLIYPTPVKYGEVLGIPYSELFRRFASAVVRPQSVLFVIGYGFGDEHVNAIIRQALAVPSFTIVIIDPKPESDFITILNEQKDQRIWVAEGSELGKFSEFVELLLPNLRDEEIRKKVISTNRALNSNLTSEGE